jgi:hypothetical protein
MNRKKIVLKHHLGLGDAIVHNGMVRKILLENPNSDIYVYSKFHNIENVKFMYRDDERINIIGVNNDYEMNLSLEKNLFDEIITTHIDSNNLKYDVFFDDSFYMSVNMNPEIKKNLFYIERNIIVENNVFDELILQNKIDKYIFIHEKPSENILIDRKKIPNDTQIIFANPKYKMFDLLKVIENAEEVHVISSSFLSLFMCKKYNNNTFAHMYADRVELSEYIERNDIFVVK